MLMNERTVAEPPPLATEQKDALRSGAAEIESDAATQGSQSNKRRTNNVILLAEDSDDMRFVLAMHLRRAGYIVVECCDGTELVRELADYLDGLPKELMEQQFDMLVCDIRMPGVSGLSVAEAALDCACFPPTILITAFGDQETHEQAARSGVIAVFDKPFELDDLLRVVQSVLASPDPPADDATDEI